MEKNMDILAFVMERWFSLFSLATNDDDEGRQELGEIVWKKVWAKYEDQSCSSYMNFFNAMYMVVKRNNSLEGSGQFDWESDMKKNWHFVHESEVMDFVREVIAEGPEHLAVSRRAIGLEYVEFFSGVN